MLDAWNWGEELDLSRPSSWSETESHVSLLRGWRDGLGHKVIAVWAQGPEYRYLSPIEKLGMATHFQPQHWGLKMEHLWFFWPTNISETSCFKFGKKPLLENQGVKVIDINSGSPPHTCTRVSTHPTALTSSLRSRRKNAERWILDDAASKIWIFKWQQFGYSTMYYAVHTTLQFELYNACLWNNRTMRCRGQANDSKHMNRESKQMYFPHTDQYVNIVVNASKLAM